MKRPFEELLDKYNRFMIAKKTGGIGKTEFASLYSDVLSLISNCFRNGKLSPDNSLIDDIRINLVDERFFEKHEGLSASNRIFNEDIDMALLERENRFGGSVKGLRM